MLVYEPEAAALYCRFQTNQNISNAKDDSNLSKKKKILVFDMGGKGLHYIVINIMARMWDILTTVATYVAISIEMQPLSK